MPLDVYGCLHLYTKVSFPTEQEMTVSFYFEPLVLSVYFQCYVVVVTLS